MAVPFQITGAGNQDARYVFRTTFSQDLVLAPCIEAWDNAETFPVKTATGSTIAKEVFTGTAQNGNIPMLYAVATTNATPGDDWKPAIATAGSANPNRLMGNTNYVTDPTTPSAGEHIYFNLGVEIPYDATIPSTSSLAHVIQIRYTYSGITPDITFCANEGTEASPSWTELASDTNGIRYCDAGTNAATGPYQLSLPESGVIDVPEILVTT